MRCKKTFIHNNQNGFTLVELLVAISILGIILVITLPQVSNIQSQNKQTKYKKYAETIVTSGKLYTDSYTEDMFGNNASGCVDIPYSEMKSKDLVKELNIDGATCASDKTFIRVRKSNDHYTYERAIYCTDKKGDVVYEETLPGSCSGEDIRPDDIGPTITISPNGSDWTNGEGQKVTISIYDDYGMLENTKINYAWTTSKGSVSESDYQLYDAQNKRYEGTTSAPLELTVSLPTTSGKYYLVVKPVDVRDANGNYQLSTTTSNVFKIDTIAPTIEDIEFPVDVTLDGAKMTLTGKDKGGSGIKKWQHSEDNTSWTDYPDSSTEEYTTPRIKASEDFDIYIKVCDYAGNCSSKQKNNYQEIPKFCACCDGYMYTESDGYGSCSVSCGGGTKEKEVYYYSMADDRYCDSETKTKKCNTDPCPEPPDSDPEPIPEPEPDYPSPEPIPEPEPEPDYPSPEPIPEPEPEPEYPPNNCNIRGSTKRTQGYTWDCTCGRQHTTGYTHYCTDSSGKLWTREKNKSLVAFSWVCPISPYGEAQGWLVISD